jgi:hypothetical protein
MPVKKKAGGPPPVETNICSFCGKEIHGDHVYIKTKRRTELHIHFECVPGRVNNKV